MKFSCNRILFSPFLFLLVALFWASSVNAGWYGFELNKLSDANGMSRVTLEINTTQGYAIESFASDNLICFNPVFLDGVCGGNRDCIRGILAHELAHIYNGDRHGSSHKVEFKADKTAVTLLRRAGMNPCAELIGFKRMQDIFGDNGGSTHPKWSLRIEAIQQECTK